MNYDDQQLEKALALFRESGRAWSEHWMEAARPVPQRSSWRPMLVSAAAAVLVATVLLLPSSPKRQPVAERPFVQIPYVAPLAPYERVEITQMDVPVAALIAAGFDLPSADPGETVRADVLMGQDGRAHAVRLLSGSLN